jgi:hypothetical protein
VEVQLHSFLTSVLHGDAGQPHCPAVYFHGKKPRYTASKELGGRQSNLNVMVSIS